MQHIRTVVVIVGLCTLWPMVMLAQTVERGKASDDDHAIVFELGAAGDWSSEDGARPGGTFAFEVTPIEQWLELEIGVTAIHTGHGIEVPVDVLFKKPWRLSPTFEFDNGPIVIENGVWLCARTTVLRGVTIGANSVVGATSLVSSDVPPDSIVRPPRATIAEI